MQGKDRLRASGGFEVFGRTAAPAAKFQVRVLRANRLRRPKAFEEAEGKGAVPLFAADILESQSLRRPPADAAKPGATQPVGSGGLKPAALDWRFSGKGRGGAK
jgi:hypothetical protein